MAELQTIYLFAQALDNKSADDYFGYHNGAVQKIELTDSQNLVQKILTETTSNGKYKEVGCTKGYFWQSGLGHKNVVLLISHGQQDHIGRDSRTALILSNYQNGSLDAKQIEMIVSSFWEKTGRKKIAIHPVDDYSKILNSTSSQGIFERIFQILSEIENLITQLLSKLKGGSSSQNKGKGEKNGS